VGLGDAMATTTAGTFPVFDATCQALERLGMGWNTGGVRRRAQNVGEEEERNTTRSGT
jgi:hypothetical protein